MRSSIASLPITRWARSCLRIEVLLLLLLPILLQAPAVLGWVSADPIFREAAISPGPAEQLMKGFPGWVDGNSGATTQALGHLAAEQWLHGQVPWWNHFTALGMPLAAEMQNSALFLPFVLLLHFQNGVIFLKIAMQVMTGLCMFALLLELNVGRAAALTGAVMLEFCGTLAWFAHGPIMPVPFLPMLVLGIERSARYSHENRRGGWALIALAIAGSIYAGFPETAYMDGLLSAMVGLLRVAQANRPLDTAARIAAGGLVGLLLAAPLWVAFAASLPVSLLGQNADFTGTHLLGASYALLLFPYALGPILFGPEVIGGQTDVWWHTGGYCDLLLVAAGVAALVRRATPRRPLRLVLGAWLLLSLAKAAGIPAITQLFDLLPFIRQTMFYVYASPGWQFGLTLLAGLLVEDLRHGIRPSPRACIVLGSIAIIVSVIAGMEAWPLVHELLARGAPHYRRFLVLSLGWAAAGTGLFLLLLRRPTLVACLLVLNAMLLFAFPLLSGTLAGTIDLKPITYLRDTLGFSRAYSVSRLAPNYGAFFGTPMLDYTYVPVPKVLARRMIRDMDPDMDVTGLFGDRLQGFGQPVPDPLKPQHTASDTIERLEALGVSDLLVAHGEDPLLDVIGPTDGSGKLSPHDLIEGVPRSGEIAVPTGAAHLRQIGLVLGTYKRHPGGALHLSLCIDGRCAETTADLSQAADNLPLWFNPWLDIPVHPGDRLRYTITLQKATGAVALWEVPVASEQASGVPFFTFRYRSDGPALQKVFDDGSSAILRLPSPRPYAEVLDGHCMLRIIDRDRFAANCSKPDRLLRRELFYPGWQATISGRSVAIVAADDGTFESVSLPAGQSEIRFHYEPPFTGPAVAAAILGLALLLVGVWRAGATMRKL